MQTFKVKPIPSPEIRLAGYRNGNRVSRKTLTEDTRIIAVRPEGFDFEIPATALRIDNVDVILPYEGSDRLPPEMASTIRQADKCDMVDIDAVVIIPNGKPVHIYSALTIGDYKK